VDDERELLRGNTQTLVLAVLRDGALHGYAIVREINRRSGDGLRCKQGTLYPVLYTLERDGLIRGAWEHAEGERPRKVYSLTDAGVAELERRVNAWRRFNVAMEGVLGGKPGAQPT
jgi:PadR family transcriptional regulator, regulatory protein PadR